MEGFLAGPVFVFPEGPVDADAEGVTDLGDQGSDGAVEVIALTMAVYLVISLLSSLAMNLYGRTTAIVER